MNGNENKNASRSSILQDGKPVLDTQPEVYEFDPLGEDTEFVTIGDLKSTYETLQVVRFKHPTKEGEFIKFLVKRTDPQTSVLTYGTAILRSAIRLAAMNERLQENKDAKVDIYEFIDDLRATKEFTLLTVAMGLVEPRIPAKQVNELLPDFMIQSLAAEINKGVVVLDDTTSRFPDNDGEDTGENGTESETDQQGDGTSDGDVGSGYSEPEVSDDTNGTVES